MRLGFKSPNGDCFYENNLVKLVEIVNDPFMQLG
jgi:hypothetical protein